MRTSAGVNPPVASTSATNTASSFFMKGLRIRTGRSASASLPCRQAETQVRMDFLQERKKRAPAKTAEVAVLAILFDTILGHCENRREFPFFPVPKMPRRAGNTLWEP